MNRQYHYPQDFESARRSFAFVFLLCCAGLALVSALSFYAGYMTAEAVCDEREKVRARMGNPKRMTPAATPATILGCDKRGLEEYHRTCRARARLEKVGAP